MEEMLKDAPVQEGGKERMGKSAHDWDATDEAALRQTDGAVANGASGTYRVACSGDAAQVETARSADASPIAQCGPDDAGAAARNESGNGRPCTPPYDGHHNIELGRRGEDAAAAFLVRHGFDIIERNWQCSAGEADIIASDAHALHFIEVKTRMSEAKGFPAEAVDAEKRHRYERIAELFLRSFEDRYDTRITFDVISILVTGRDRAFLRMHRDVFANDCR